MRFQVDEKTKLETFDEMVGMVKTLSAVVRNDPPLEQKVTVLLDADLLLARVGV